MLVCFCVPLHVLRVRFGWNWCESFLTSMQLCLGLNCPGMTPQRPTKGTTLWIKTAQTIPNYGGHRHLLVV